MTTKSKCCGAEISAMGSMAPFGSSTIHYFCGACGKCCELVAAPDPKPKMTEKLTDEQWATQFADNEARKILGPKKEDPDDVFSGLRDTIQFQSIAHLIDSGAKAGLAEGRKRNAEECKEREKAIAEEAWMAADSTWTDEDLDHPDADELNFEAWWKQREGGK